eukprot:7838464-Alexandrium_andersonii.AAC.1
MAVMGLAGSPAAAGPGAEVGRLGPPTPWADTRAARAAMAAADVLVVRTNAVAPLTQADPVDGGAAAWPLEASPLEGLQSGIQFPPPIEHIPLPQD